MGKSIYILTLTCLVVVLMACRSTPSIPADQMPDLGIAATEMNTHFRMIAPDGWNTFKIKDNVTFDVEVISEDPIAFRYDYGAVVFLYQNHQWIEIPQLGRNPEGYLVLSPAKGDPFKTGAASVSPVIYDNKKPITLRVILIGNIYRDGKVTDEQTAAYCDVTLKP